MTTPRIWAGASLGLGWCLTAVAATAATGDPLWRYEEPAAAVCGPLVVSGQAVVSATRAIGDVTDESSPDILIRAFDPRSGTVLWQAAENTFRDEHLAVAAAGNLVITSTSARPKNGSSFGTLHLRARNASDGSWVWQQTVPTDAFAYEAWAFAADARTAVIAGAAQRRETSEYIDLFAMAFDTATGRRLWNHAVDVDRNFDLATAAAVGEGFVAVGGIITDEFFDYFHVRVYSARNGELLWEDRVDGGQALQLTIKAGRLYATGYAGYEYDDGSHLRVYNLRTGSLVWARHIPRVWMQHLSVVGKRVVVAGNRRARSHIKTYNRKTGKKLWQDQWRGANVIDLAAGKNRVFAISLRARRSLISARKAGSGKIKWLRESGVTEKDEFACSLALADRGLVVSNFEETFVPPENRYTNQHIVRGFVP